jgi:hypothetical protein
METAGVKDAENDVKEILVEFGLPPAEVDECSAQLIELLTDALAAIVEDSSELAKIIEFKALDLAKS